MCLFLVLFWCSFSWDDAEAETFLAIIPGSASLIPDWAGANSRFALWEFAGNGLICLTVFAAKTAVARGKSTKFPVRREKPGITVGGAWPTPCDYRNMRPSGGSPNRIWPTVSK